MQPIFAISNMLTFTLAAMALGYFVCLKANKEQGILKLLGLVLGSIIIIITLLSSATIIRLGFAKQTVTPGMMRPSQPPMSTRPMVPQQPAPNK